MIDDKTAKMAINTLKAYCQQFDNCGTCAIQENCWISLEERCDRYPVSTIRCFPRMNLYMDVSCFVNSDVLRTPKFDIKQKDSVAFRNYINKIFMEEAEKYGLPMNTANSIKWTARGTIVVMFVGDDDKMNYIGVAKCHPDDAFNPEIGIKLAVERAAQAMHAPFIPGYNEHYYCVGNKDTIYSTVNRNEAADALCIALGNSFRTYNQAKANAGVIIKRIERATELLKKLQDEGEE
ncbi:hypothetical protein [Megasphaera sp.]|uniref:hypothetical protein n=1 Tax=Megasphaera sp. TaxID=2023260 RepID=UPI003A957341